MKKRRPRRKNQSQNYAVLEPRQLLATTGLTQFDGDSSINSGLITNGNFDANQIDTDEDQSVSQRFPVADVTGWTQSAGAADEVSLVSFFDSPRGTGLHLDDQADVLESVFQDVNTESGQLYTLAFDLLGRPQGANASADSNDIRILWDNVDVGTFRGINDFWQTFTVNVTGASNDLTRLEIQEVDGAGNDGVGAMLDNIRLVPVTSQTFENGSFEDNETGLIGHNDVPGWNVVADENNQIIDVESGTGSDGTRFLNLDRMTDASDILFAETTTEAGGVYFVSFDLRSESGVVGEDEEVRVRWNDQWVGTYRGTADWQGYGFTVRADSDMTRLVFREPGNAFTGDGNGPLLDNVRITRVISEVTLTLSDTTPFEFTENGDAVAIGSRIDAINSTVEDSISSVTVSLPANADSSETLRATVGSETVESVDGVLTVSGSRSIADYLSILQSVEYSNTSDDPIAGNRVLTLRVFSGGETPAQDNLTVNVTAVPDAPVVASITNTSATVGQEFTTQATATDPENDTLTWTVSATGTAIEADDAVKVLNSFALIDTFDGVDKPMITANGSVFVTVSVSAVIVEIGISGGVTVTVGIDLYDQNPKEFFNL